MPEVTVLGQICADVLCRRVDSLPERGTLRDIDRIVLSSGGCGLNTAISYRKLGEEVSFIGKIGQDGFGDYLHNVLTENKVDTRGLIRSKIENTSASAVLVDSGGERSFLHFYGVNSSLTDNEINWNIINESRFLAICGVFLMKSFDGEPAARVLKEAKRRGKITLLDTAWDTSNRWMDVLAPCMPHIDYFLPSFEEASRLAGTSDLNAAADNFLARGVKNVVIKTGCDGCFIKNHEMSLVVPGYTVDIVDTTGAGDSFVAGFLAGLRHGFSLKQCAMLGNAMGAFSVTAIGASTAIPHYEDILYFIQQKGGFA